VLGHGVISEGKDEEAAREDAATGVEFVREWDGAADGRIQGMITPHAPYTCDDWLLREAAEARDELGCGLQIHLSETADEVEEIVGETGERPAWYCDEMGCWDDHASAAHCVHLDSDEMRLLADRGVAAVHCPAANMKLAAGAAPVDELLAKGVTVALGTDGPASNNDLDLLGEARRAALLAKVREEDASAVDAATALEMATVNGADALDVDAGAVEVGRKGDLAVVDMAGAHTTPRHDLVSNAVYAASGSDVTATVVGGEVLMEDGEVLTLDVEAVKREAADRAADLVERAEAEEGS
jgi:5-methylthioadenosine/S-adenosylhomocysteine deaminase